MLLIMVPLILLYELSILLAVFLGRPVKRDEDDDDEEDEDPEDPDPAGPAGDGGHAVGNGDGPELSDRVPTSASS